MSVIEDARREIAAKKAALTAEPVAEVVKTEETPPETPPAEVAPVVSETPPADVVTPEVVAETPATEVVTEEKPAGWNKPLQKVQQELANQKRNHEETQKTLQEILIKLDKQAAATAPTQTPAQQEAVKDEIATLREQIAEVEADPYAAPKALKIMADQLDAVNQRLKAYDTQDADARKVADDWRKWSAANPEVPVDQAQGLVQQCLAEAAQKGYSGPAQQTRANELFTERLATLKKTPSPTTTTPQTAPAARVSTPAGVRVTPANSGVRTSTPPPQASTARAAGNLGRRMLGLKPI